MVLGRVAVAEVEQLAGALGLDRLAGVVGRLPHGVAAGGPRQVTGTGECNSHDGTLNFPAAAFNRVAQQRILRLHASRSRWALVQNLWIGLLPTATQPGQTMPDLRAAITDLETTGQHCFDETRDNAKAFARDVGAAMGRRENELELRHVGPEWTYVLIDHSHSDAGSNEKG